MGLDMVLPDADTLALFSADIAHLERYTGLLAWGGMAFIFDFECGKEGKLLA